MNDVEVLEKLIQGRRSVFPASYIQKEMTESVIAQILESANYAPTHKLTQPWRFVVFTNAAKANLGLTMANLYKTATPPDKFLEKKYNSFSEKTAQAGCIVAINIQFHADKVPAWEEIAATACAVQNMALTAQALQIGTYWSSPAVMADLGSFLGLAENEKCYGLFYMGYHNEPLREANRTPMAPKIKWLTA